MDVWPHEISADSAHAKHPDELICAHIQIQKNTHPPNTKQQGGDQNIQIAITTVSAT